MAKRSPRKNVCYTAGRPPWYNSSGQLSEAFMIGISGGSASGKTTVSRTIISELGVPWVVIISLDSFYKALSQEQHEAAQRGEYNFDHPDAFEWDLAYKTLKKLKEGRNVKIPVYDFTTHSRLTKQKNVYGANVIIFEGIMTFFDERILKLLDMRVFVDTDSDIRLARRLRRDIKERGRDTTGVLTMYNKYVKPMFDQYIAPSVKVADIVVPWEGENKVAVNLIVQHVSNQLEKRGFNFRSELIINHKDDPIPNNLHVLENTPQVRGLQAIVRDCKAKPDDFVFYSKRLMRILMEKVMSLMPFEPTKCETQDGETFTGLRCKDTFCGVSILRAGEALEDALVTVCKDAKIGKILIQTNINTSEPELHYQRLPSDIDNCQVILMDATVASGAAAMMAIRILLDHDVPEHNITFATLVMGQSGVHTLACAFPSVRIVTAAVDPETNDRFHIVPGIGNFGNRYFGTEVET